MYIGVDVMTNVRTIDGRYGEYILIDDLISSMRQDEIEALRDENKIVANYVASKVATLEKLKLQSPKQCTQPDYDFARL